MPLGARATLNEVVEFLGNLTDVLFAADNHLLNVDVMSMGKTGAEVQELLDRANITANKNAIPFDTLPVRQTSGMRFGTPAVTTRGMKETEMHEIGAMIGRILREGEDAVDMTREQTVALCERFPLYPEM